VGEVLAGALIGDLEHRNRVHSRHGPERYAALRHRIVPLKGSVVEVIAESCEVHRVDNARPLPTRDRGRGT
jgi:hypothetical protein